MATRHRRRLFLAPLALVLLALAASVYFVRHGQSGLAAKTRAEAEASAVKARLDGLRAERETLERRVTLLRDGALDRDMLDERARVILNFGQTSDVVVLAGPLEQAQVPRP